MSELLKKIKDAALQARKTRNTDVSAPLITLIGDIEAVGKKEGRDVTDLEVTALLKKYIKNANETAIQAEKHEDAKNVTASLNEVRLYESFLPAQLDEAELREIIGKFISGTTIPGQVVPRPSIGVVSKLLKEEHGGSYDGAVAARLIKEALQ